MLSDLWTLQSTAEGAEEKTLAAWGFDGAQISAVSLGGESLSLSLKGDGLTHEDLWSWEEELVLYRDGEVYWRGYVAETPRMFSPRSEGVGYVLKNAWWLLERLTFRQSWSALVGSGIDTAEMGRFLLADTADNRRVTQVLATLQTFVTASGISLTIDSTGITDLVVPPIEGHNRTVADIIKTCLRWYPHLALVADYSASGTTLRVVSATASPANLLKVGTDAIDGLDIRALPELQVDACRVIYETQASRYEVVTPGEEDDFVGGFRKTAARVVASDTYPAGAAITRRSLVVTMPYPSQAEGSPLAPTMPPQPTEQPVQTETYPASGDYDTTTERWWLKRSGLEATFGLTVDQIRLPRTTDKDIVAHTVALDESVVQEPPSAVNPNSTPLWAPDTIADVPKELISGMLSDWMDVKQYPATATVTIAVSVAAVNALSAPKKSAFMRLGPRKYTMTIEGVDYPAWLLDARWRFTATNALTKVYRNKLDADRSGAAENPSAATSDEYANAVANAVIPDLAKRLYEARSSLLYAGSCTLVSEEIDAKKYLGRRLSIYAADRPEWMSLGAVVQRETIRLESGDRSLVFGPPEQLGPQDWAELHTAARARYESRSTVGAGSPPVGNQSPPSDPDNDEELNEGNPIIGASVTPTQQFEWLSGGTGQILPWDIEQDGTTPGGWVLVPGTILESLANLETVIEIVNVGNTWEPTAGQILRLKVTGDFDDPTITLEIGGAWTDHPSSYETTGSGGSAEFTSYFFPLWEFLDTEGERTIPINTGVYGRKLAPNCEGLLRTATVYHQSGNRAYGAPILIPYHGSLTGA